MSQSLECPRCHQRAESRGSGWKSRSCPNCRAPMVLAPAPAEAMVRSYLYGAQLAPMGAPPPRGRRG